MYYEVCIFFQAEDGIRDVAVTGVQTCALPISLSLITILTILNFGDRTACAPAFILAPSRHLQTWLELLARPKKPRFTTIWPTVVRASWKNNSLMGSISSRRCNTWSCATLRSPP